MKPGLQRTSQLETWLQLRVQLPLHSTLQLERRWHST
jgi:hypothetical protein